VSARVDAPPPGGSRSQRRNADLGTRQPALRVLGVQRR
jgi:hypothetical protein